MSYESCQGNFKFSNWTINRLQQYFFVLGTTRFSPLIEFTLSAKNTYVVKFFDGTPSRFISTISVYRTSEQSYGLKIWIFWTTIYKLTNNQKPYLSFENIINGSEIAGIVYLSYFRVFDNIQVKKFFSRVCLCDERSSFWKRCNFSKVTNLLKSDQI